MFIIRAKTNSTVEGQPPRYLCHAIPVNDYVFVTFGGKSDAKTFGTRDAAAYYLKRHGALVKDYDIEQAEPGK